METLKKSKNGVKRTRQMSVKDPELVLEQRRIRVSRISDSSLQRIKIEYIGGEILDPISHETSSTSTILFHKIKRLQCFNNYNYSAYLSACKSKKRYALVTVVPNDTEKNWICHNRLISIDKKKDSNEGTENAGCLQVNCNSNQFCAKCHSQRNSCKMRPYFRILQRLSFTARDRRATVLKKIESIDDELARCFEAVKCIDILNKDKLPPNIRENIRNLTSIDLDLVQNNVLQRIEVAAMGPILKRLVEQKKEVLMRLWEECVIVTQLVYTMAVVHIQRYVRGFLPRSRLDKVRVLYIQRKQHVAAIDIQCMVRSYISKHALQNRLYQRKIAFITLLQCFFRQTIAKISRNSLALEIKRCLQIKAAVVVQKRIRKYIAQIYFASLLKLKQDEIAEKARSQTQHILTSAAIIIQTTFRRFIACQVLHLLQTESGLHPRIRFHAEKFLQKGRLWSFLWCLSEDFRRYERRIDEMLFEEEVNATTFINKITKVREKELKQAWNKYREIKSHPKNQACFDGKHPPKSKSLYDISFPFINEALQSDNDLGITRNIVANNLGYGYQHFVGRNQTITSVDQSKRYLKGSRSARNYDKIKYKDCLHIRNNPNKDENHVDRDICYDFGHGLKLNGSVRNPYKGEALSSICLESEKSTPTEKWITKYSTNLIRSTASDVYLEHRCAPRIFFD